MIVNRLSRLLGDRRMSVRELARRTGLAESGLYELWNDRTRRVDFHTLDRLCAVLGCTTGDLLEYVPDQAGQDQGNGTPASEQPSQPRARRHSTTPAPRGARK